MKNFVDEDSQGPNISFRAIHIMYEAFRAHVDRAAYGDVSKVGGGFDGETEVANFILPSCYKDIGDLDVAVDDRER